MECFVIVSQKKEYPDKELCGSEALKTLKLSYRLYSIRFLELEGQHQNGETASFGYYIFFFQHGVGRFLIRHKTIWFEPREISSLMCLPDI